VALRTRLALAAAGALLAPLAIAAPAHAVRWDHTDAARDMYGRCEPAGLPPEECPAEGIDPTRIDGDFRTTWVNHGVENLVVRSHFSALAAYEYAYYRLAILTPDGQRYEYRISFIRDGNEFQKAYPYGTPPKLVKADGNSFVSCPGLKKSVSYSNDIIEAVVPRSCLGKPYKVSLQPIFERRSNAANGIDMYSDMAFDGFSPWIKRG
jgi:hypothetical protein